MQIISALEICLTQEFGRVYYEPDRCIYLDDNRSAEFASGRVSA